MNDSLEKLCKIVEHQIDKAVDVLDREGGKLPADDAEYLDKLTHTLKSIKTIMAMEGYGSSERRDSMGRYTSRDSGNVREHIMRMMEETTDDRVRRALREAMNEL